MCAVRAPDFGLLLRRHRRAARLTQEELAERTGLSVRGLGDLERGVRLPRQDTLRLLLDVLRLPPDEESRMVAAARDRSPVTHSVGLERSGSFLGSAPSGRIVGRETEIGRLVAGLEGVVGGAGRLLLLTGEPGIGKTRVAQEMTLEAVRRGFLVATGRCYEPERDVPFHPFIEALAATCSLVSPAIRDSVPQRWPHLAALLPDDVIEAAEHPVETRPTGMEGQQRLFRAIAGFLIAAAEECPIALLLDDLHWADDASLKLLLYLARQTRESPVLLLGTYRDVDVDAGHPLERVLVDLNRDRLLERLALRHFDVDQTAELIVETVGGDVVDLPSLAGTVYHVTNGNPFFIQEIIAALVDRSDIYPYEGRWHRRAIESVPAPDTVRSAIQQRLARLDTVSREVLHEASVLGSTFAFDELEAISGHDEDALDAALDSATAIGLLREAGGGRYTFNHVLTQNTLYTDLSQRRRQRLHLAAAEAIARQSEQTHARRAAELARHFREGGDTGRAITYSLLAGERAESLFAYDDAQRHFQTAVRLATGASGEPADPSVLPRALARLGRILDIVEKYDDALEVLERAAALFADQGDTRSEAMIVAEIGWIHHNRRTDEQGIDRVRSMLGRGTAELPQPVRDRITAILHTALARLYFGLGRYADELRAAECAVAASIDIDDPVVRAVARARRGAVLMTLGRSAEARAELDAAIALSETTGNLGTMSVALGNLAEISAADGDYARAGQEIDRSLQIAEQTGLPGRIGWTLVKLGRIRYLIGEWGEARKILRQSIRLFEDDDRPAFHPRAMLAEIDAWTGDLPRSKVILEECAAAARRTGNRWLFQFTSRALASIELCCGEADAAWDRLAPLVGDLRPHEPHSALLFAPLARSLLELGRPKEAAAMIEHGVAQAELQHNIPARVDLHIVRGSILVRNAKYEEALRILGGAVAQAEAMPDPLRQGLVLSEMSHVALAMGEARAAEEHHDTAIIIARRLDARTLESHLDRAWGTDLASHPGGGSP